MTQAAAARPVLIARVLTAAVLLAGCVSATFLLSNLAWALLVLAVVLAGGREWAALSGWGRPGQAAYCLALGVIALFLYAGAQGGLPWLAPIVFGMACGFWVSVAPLLMRRTAWRPGRVSCACLGLAVLLPAWLAVVVLQAAAPALLLLLLGVVWLADSAAYFAGRAWGRTKLAPTISPGKTWEGVAGAAVAVAVYYVAFSLSGPRWEWVGTVSGAVLFAGMLGLSIVGDLFESWIKRRAGFKDSGALLPGHGGVLDRIDGLVAAMPLAGLFMMLQG